MSSLRRRFLKVYANLPLGIRRDVIAVIDEQPMSWFACWVEIDNMTEKSKEILEYLVKMEFI